MPRRVRIATCSTLLANAGTDQAPTAVRAAATERFALRADATRGDLRVARRPRDDPTTSSSRRRRRARSSSAARGCRITWDDRADASVDAPLDLLFGAGTLHNPDGREWLVKALPMAIRFIAGRVVLELPVSDAVLPRGEDRTGRARTPVLPIDDVRWALRCAPYDGAVESRRLFSRDVSRPRRAARSART